MAPVVHPPPRASHHLPIHLKGSLRRRHRRDPATAVSAAIGAPSVLIPRGSPVTLLTPLSGVRRSKAVCLPILAFLPLHVYPPLDSWTVFTLDRDGGPLRYTPIFISVARSFPMGHNV